MNTIFSHAANKPAAHIQVRAPLYPHSLISARAVMILLAACMALIMTGFVMILPLFARRFNDFGSGVEALGISAMAYALSGTLAAPFMGALADRFGRRPLVLVGLAAYSLAFSGYLLASSAWSLILLRGLGGIFTAGLTPAVTGIVADLAPADRRAQWIGIVNGGAAAGWIVGPLLGGVLYDRFGYALPLALAIVVAAITFGIAALLVPETHPRTTLQTNRSKVPGGQRSRWARLVRDSFPRSLPIFWMILWISFVVLFAWAFIEPQFMFYAYGNLHWTSSQLGLAMSAYGVTLTLGEFMLGRWSDRWGRKPVLLLGLGLFISQFVGLALFQDFTWITLSFVLAGLGNAIYDPALSAYLLDIAPANHQARTMGIKSTIGSLGSVLGPALVVVCAPYFRPQHIFAAAAILVGLTILATYFFLKPNIHNDRI